MKLGLFQEVFELNQVFEGLIRRLKRLEKVPLFQRDLIQNARADVETACVDANREFFDNFEAIVENDAKWAYEFQRDLNQALKDPDDIYLEVRNSEERRQKKGLPPRVVILPNWDMSDEERYDEEQAKKRKKATTRRHRTSPRAERKFHPMTRHPRVPATSGKGGSRP